MSLSHHVLLVGGRGAEGVVVLLMPLVHPAHLQPILIRFSLVVVALVEFGTIHLGLLLVGQVGSLVIHATLIKSTTLRIHKPLLPLILIFIYAYINPSGILLRALTRMLLVGQVSRRALSLRRGNITLRARPLLVRLEVCRVLDLVVAAPLDDVPRALLLTNSLNCVTM